MKEECTLVEQAKAFARNAHEGQTRKSNGAPYFTHVEMVARTVAEYTGQPEMIAAGYLHDTIEDCNVTYAELKDKFGAAVANFVYDLTNDEEAIRRLGKTEYLVRKLAMMNPDALLIKLCDVLSNMRDQPPSESAKRYLTVLDETRNALASNHPGIWSDNHEDLSNRIMDVSHAMGKNR